LSLFNCLSSLEIYENGARRRNRTADTRIFNPLLYQLSYPGTVAAMIALSDSLLRTHLGVRKEGRIKPVFVFSVNTKWLNFLFYSASFLFTGCHIAFGLIIVFTGQEFFHFTLQVSTAGGVHHI
jgi:uncharacterized membrane protein